MENAKEEVAVFGGGCFWCTEAIFQNLKGVLNVTSGYTGGQVLNPSYEQVSTGATGHAEVIKIEFDPAEISYYDLLEIFFAMHDPTTPDRQGNDVGTQYRSIIFFTTPTQKQEAQRYVSELDGSGVYDEPVITQVEPLAQFYEAENYHMNYYRNNSTLPYCQLVISPKLVKLRQKFANKLIA